MRLSIRLFNSSLRLPFQRIDFAVCAIFRDEANYLDEWLNFHHKNGVSHFFLINHRSKDHYKEVLEPWIRDGIVSLVNATEDDQVAEYNKVLNRVRNQVRWLAFIDIDEFLFSPTQLSLPKVMKRFKGIAGVFVYWRLFGSSGIPSPVGSAGVVRSFQLCLPRAIDLEDLKHQKMLHRQIKGNTKMTGAPVQGKCIIRPSKVKVAGVHWPDVFEGDLVEERGERSTIHFPKLESELIPSMELIRINHYWSRSIEELEAKSIRDPIHRGLRDNNNLKTLPAGRSMLWDKQLNKSLDNAALENLGLDLPFVFLIGFNKTATRTFHHFFEKNGFPAIHWDKNRLVQAMLENKQTGKRILSGYEDFRVFSDFTLITDDEYFEGNSLFRELFVDYPSAYFILNNRKTNDWLDSRLRQNSGQFAQRHLKLRNLNSADELRVVWASEKSQHESGVRQFFANHARFVEVDINGKDVPMQLSLFMRRDFLYREWPVIRRLSQNRP